MKEAVHLEHLEIGIIVVGGKIERNCDPSLLKVQGGNLGCVILLKPEVVSIESLVKSSGKALL